jgi:hypothetical protein
MQRNVAECVVASQRVGEAPPDDRLREAIQSRRGRLDCFVAYAPRNDGGKNSDRIVCYFEPNALKVMMVWVSSMPGITWTFSLTKWPMSVSLST